MSKFEQSISKNESKEQIKVDSLIYPLINEQLQHRYDRISTEWDSEKYANTRRDDLVPRLIEAAQVEDGHYILEVMCGTATVARLIKEKNKTTKVQGLDFSIGMLNQIPKDISSVQASVLGMPFEDQTFDKVFLRSAIYDLPKRMQRNALHEISRIMKNSAVFIFQTYLSESHTTQTLNDIANMKDRLSGQYQDMGKESPRYFATEQEFDEWFEKVGLKNEIIHHFSSGINLEKASEMSDSSKKQFVDFITGLPKKMQEAINLRLNEEGNYTYTLPGIIYRITKQVFEIK